MSQISDIKTAVQGHLNALKTAGKFGTVIVDDFRTNPDTGLGKNIASYPAAILGSPAITSAYETNRDNMRTFDFEILVMCKGENVNGIAVIEDLIQTILDEFDNDPTLGGKANGAVEPSASNPEAVSAPDGTFIIFTISVKARALVTLTF
jgi:hypothetical protein